ncbi:T9SS type A sorting domain-containing protein [Aureivirga sp. CE67]|uniref:T9SS type A sorting domain-containing protein n=1 Tax=Aureivirga sp. CE67 TaxID=1788983 RepID=UPI0018CB87F3|nr:T9SS type A sorting domain-containing protein [Aureivirga sp. CE67]
MVHLLKIASLSLTLSFTQNFYAQETDPCENDETPPVVDGYIADHSLKLNDECSLALPNYINLNIFIGTDNCSQELEVYQTPEPGTVITEDTEVSITFEDEAGNKASKSFMVFAVDEDEPIFDCLENKTEYIDGSTTVLADYTTEITNVEDCSTYTITQNPPTGTVVELGTQTIEITVEDSFENSVTCEFDISFVETLSTEEFTLNQNHIYPNPAKNYFSVKDSKNIKEIKIYDSLGKIVLNKKSNFNEKVDISSLEKGIYQIIIEEKNKKIQQQIIIE